MKNYFSTVIIPKSGATPAALSSALSELVDQLRYTVNNLDLDNMTKETRDGLTKAHVMTPEQIEKNGLSGVKKGDLVVSVSSPWGRLSKINEIYICTSDK